jgi:hypothetical protein
LIVKDSSGHDRILTGPFIPSINATFSKIASIFSQRREETTGLAAGLEDTFIDHAKAYNQVYDYLKLRYEKVDYDEAVFDNHLSSLNYVFDRSIRKECAWSADDAFKMYDCGFLVRPEGFTYEWPEFRFRLTSFDYRETPNMFVEAAVNHSDIFINKFLETYHQDGYDSAMAAAQEALMNMPTSTSMSNISFRDLNIIINAEKKGCFDDLNDLKNSGLSDFMKEYLEDDWLEKLQLAAECTKKLIELDDEWTKLWNQLMDQNLKGHEKEAIEERLQAIADEIAEWQIKHPWERISGIIRIHGSTPFPYNGNIFLPHRI